MNSITNESMNTMEIFNYEGAQVRTLNRDGEPWFVGKDVAEVLGYERGTKAVVDHVDDDDREMIDQETQSHFGIEIGQRGGWLINESGLYSLILSSKLPTAKAFKRWVTNEVLPTVRKHGLYATPDTLERLIASPEFGIRLLTELKEERARNAAQAEQIKLLEPKASYCDMVLASPDLVTVTQIAKDYGLSAVTLNKILESAHIQFKRDEQWHLYQRYAKEGYAQSKTYSFEGKEFHAKMHTLWTQKGRLFIYDLLKEKGILPIMERA